MLRAMALLAAPTQSVQQAASAVGFDSVGGSFTRAFSQFCGGETPVVIPKACHRYRCVR